MILSIDIGIHNLAMCIISANDKKNIETYKIELWDVYNILDDDILCKNLQKNGNICNKKSSCNWENENKEKIYCCKKHFPKNLLPINKTNLYKKKLISDYLLQDLTKLILIKLNNIYDNNKEIFINLNEIIIELQPKVNPRMKFVSHIIYCKLTQLFIDTNTSIKFIRASQKLKAYTGPPIECSLKGAYAKRKWLSIQYGIWFLENKFNIEEKEKWLPLLKNGKLDDKFDTFAMCINGLYGILKKQKTNKNGKCIK